MVIEHDKDTEVVYCRFRERRTMPADVRSNVRIVRVPCFELATELKSPRGANIIMTGAIIRLMGDFTGDEACAAMNHMFAKKGKSKFEAANTAAFQAGYNAL